MQRAASAAITMQLSFNYLPSDLQEALHPPPPAAQRRQIDRTRYFLLGLLFIVVAILLFVLLLRAQTRSTVVAAYLPAPAPPMPQNLFVSLVPGLIPAMFATVFLLWITAVVIRSARRRSLGDEQRAQVRSGLAFLASAAISFLPMVLLLDRFRVDWHPDSPVAPVILNLAPWIVPLVLLIVVVILVRRLSAGLTWATRRSLHRSKAVTIDEAGLRITDDVVDHLYRWAALTRYRETANLFIVTTEDKARIVIPKRAIPTPADFDAFCAILQNHISDGEFLRRASSFPVVPLAARAPVP